MGFNPSRVSKNAHQCIGAIIGNTKSTRFIPYNTDKQ